MPKQSLLDSFTDEQFEQIIHNSTSIKEVCYKLGYTGHSGANSKRIKNRMEQLGLSSDQFQFANNIPRTPENIFIENSTAAQKTVRKYYYAGNYTPYKCSICGQEPFWNNKPLIMILDHINGKNQDDRLENLRWVCPNCNYQLDTTNAKNWIYQRNHS